MEINKIYNEDCLETMKKMPDNFIDLTVTSPPYDNLRDYNGYSFNFESVAKELFRVTKNGGVVVWVVGDATINGSETGTSFKQALYFKEIGFNLHDTMIYETDKAPNATGKRYQTSFEYMFVLSKGPLKTFNPIKQKRKWIDRRKRKCFNRQKNGEFKQGNLSYSENVLVNNVWYYTSGAGLTTNDKIMHPATFPDKLASDHIYSWSNENDLIYDPFMGSGTTAKMAHIYKRRWLGSEISKEYVEIANKRLNKYLTQTVLF